MIRAATEIDVEVFHDTLIWPLLMRGAEGEKGIEKFVQAFGAAGWCEAVADPPEQVHPDFDYDEIVYFHPFVRDFLFGDGNTQPTDRAVRRLTRKDVNQVKIEIQPGEPGKQDPFTVVLKVERVELLLIRPRIAMLIVEVSNRKPDSPVPFSSKDTRNPLKLEQVLYLQAQLRNIYPPYFDGTRHGDCPNRVVWSDLKVEGVDTAASKDHLTTFVRTGAEPPMYAHWQVFFGNQVTPLKSARDRGGAGLHLQQLLDHRIPSMSFIGVEDPSAIHPNVEDRLPAFDPPDLEYEQEFRDRQRESLRYTRFRHWGTTYYGNGTSMSVVTPEGDFLPILLRHYRKHYLHMAVIAQYQHSALLYFADELADIAKVLAVGDRGGSDASWRDRIRKLQHRFLKFRTRSYFTEVSNQIQGKDLFKFWYEHLGTRELFERVSQTNTEVYEALENYEMRELAEAQTDMTTIATWFIPLSIALGVFSIVFDWTGTFPDEVRVNPALTGWPVVGPMKWLLIAGLISLVSWLVCFIWVRCKLRSSKPAESAASPPSVSAP